MVSPLSTMRGRIEAMALYAGEGVAAIKQIEPAGQVVRTLVADAEERLLGRPTDAAGIVP